MATRSPLLRIHDMLESIRGIEKALAGKTMRDYERSWLLRSPALWSHSAYEKYRTVRLPS